MHTSPGFFMMKLALIQLALTPALLLSSNAATTRYFDFARTADYLDPGNWRSGAPPCPRDTARLPNTVGQPPLIGLSAPVSPRELLLPAAQLGETGLVMFDGAELRAFDTAEASSTPGCRDVRIRQADFNLTTPADWFHPGNWRRSGGRAAAEDRFELFDALPVDRVPGVCDAVWFQASSIYWVQVLGPGDSVPVGELTFGGRKFGQDNQVDGDFAEYWRGSAHSYVAAQFPRWSPAVDAGATSVEDDGTGSSAPIVPPIAPVGAAPVTDSQCEIPLPVQNPALMQRVCADTGERGICSLGNLALLNCPHPVEPNLIVGACCSLCGLGVTLKADESGLFHLSLVKDNLLKFVRQLGAAGKAIRLSAIRISVQDATYQIFVACTSGGDGGTCDDTVEGAMELLESRSSALHYQIINSTYKGQSKQPGPISPSSGLAGYLSASLLIVVMLVVAALLIVCYRRGRLSPRLTLLSWWQRRPRILQEEGGPADAEVSVAEGTSTVSYTAASQSVSVCMAFSNPTYMYDVSQPDGVLDLSERSVVVPEEGAEADREV